MEKIQFAHNLRGIAALMVVICHIGILFFVSPAQVQSLVGVPSYHAVNTIIVEFFSKLSYFNTGAFGVSLFFLISGFVIPFSLHKYSRKQFIVSRFMRIIPTYAAGCCISYLAVFVAAHFYGYNFPYTIKDIIINIFLLGDIFHVPSIDGVVWTLQIELKYYIICIFCMYYIQKYDYLKIVLISLGIIGLFIFLNIFESNLIISKIRALIFQLGYICFMFIGTMFNFLYAQKLNIIKFSLSVLTLFLVFAIILFYGNNSAFYISINYAFGLIIFASFYIFRDRIRFFCFFSKLADISYSLYVVHAPISYVIMRMLIDKYSNPYFLIFIAVAISILLAFLINHYIENSTNKLGKQLARGLG